MMSGGGAPPHGLLLSGRFPELEDALCERVAELRQGGRLDALTVVVGSSAMRTRIGDLLVRRLGAVANVRVLTLARLAADLVAGARGAPPAVLAGLARERLLRRLVAERASTGLAYFGPVAERPHFAQALAATFADLREARVEPGLPWAHAAVGQGPRATDLDVMYRAYCDELDARALDDGAGLHLAAATAVSAGRLPGRVVVYGIHDLNQAQEALFGALAAAGADLLVPVPRGVTRPSAALDVGRAASLGERVLEPSAEAADRERLAAVWRSRDAAPSRLPLDGDGTLAVVSVPDERAEVREAVRAVVAAAAGGAALWDCAVVVPHGDDVERVASGLAAAGLPVACRLPDRSMGPRLLLRLGECLAPPAGPAFARRAVVDLLSAAPLRGMQEPRGGSALWLDEARQAGVVSGLGQWAERVRRRRRGLQKRVGILESRHDEVQPGDDEDVEGLQSVRLRLAAARSLEAAVDRFAGACGELPERARWETWAEALGEAAGRLFEPPAGEAARDAAARLSALGVVGEEAGVAEAVAVLREHLAAARVPVGRVGRDGVAVLTPLEVRGLSFHTIAFTGLAEGGFPVRGRPDPLLGDAERRRLAEGFAARLPLADQREAESVLLFAFVAEAAREHLTLLAPRTDASSGRPRLPSRLLLRLASLVAGHSVTVDEYLSGAPLAPVWRHAGGAPAYSEGVVWVDRRERDTAALLALSEGGRPSAAAGYLREVLADSAAVERRSGAWRASRSPAPGAWDGLLGGEARAALAARHPFDAEMHPTRLERYVGCPFAFLLRDVLGLDTPDEPGDALEIDPLAFGTLAHDILEQAFTALIGPEAEQGSRTSSAPPAGDSDEAAANLDLDSALAAVTAAWESSCADAERRGVTGAALSWGVRRGTLLEDLLECVRRDPIFVHRDGRPVAVEWSFGERAGRPVTLELAGGREVRFAGRVDRIDATSSGARVIDYKTGAGNAERSRINDGLSVQLPVYQLAVRQAGGDDYGEVRSLYRLVTRRGGFDDLPLPADERATHARLRELVDAAAALVDAGMFPRTTRGSCDFCDVRYACGASAWARARKREHEALRPVVALQRPAGKEGDDGA